jgi:3-hydroxy-9,10-secoandrosta-1,3,5(10)-triene-9,17-dione monooxygenase reductase component
MTVTFDSRDFRRILGHYPTGVCAVTAMDDEVPIGMVVGSFTSVSLDPPLVAFLPDRKSNTWSRIKSAGRFCVNVLGDHQEDVCRALASRQADKFAGLTFRHSTAGMPILNDVLAWIDCDLYAVHEAGDHFIAIGKVHSLDVSHPGRPLLFFQSGYGRFSPLTEAV